MHKNVIYKWITINERNTPDHYPLVKGNRKTLHITGFGTDAMEPHSMPASIATVNSDSSSLRLTFWNHLNYIFLADVWHVNLGNIENLSEAGQHTLLASRELTVTWFYKWSFLFPLPNPKLFPLPRQNSWLLEAILNVSCIITVNVVLLPLEYDCCAISSNNNKKLNSITCCKCLMNISSEDSHYS